MMPDKLNHYLKKWQLSNAKPLAQTATSYVYTVEMNGETAVLKLLTPIGIHDEHAGAVALECFDGQAAVRLFHYDDEAHLMEYIDGTDLVPMVENGDDEGATIIIARILNQIHNAYQGKAPDGLWTLKRRFQSLFIKAQKDEKADIDSVFRRAAPIAKKLLDNPQEERVLHGDIHHWNIRHHATRGWLAFDPKGVYGERTFDAANTLCNPMTMTELVTDETRLLRNAEILAKHLHIELSRLLSFAFAYTCLSAAWSLEDDDDPYLALTVAKMLEAHVLSN
jgi:streptomycin 6-kinase